MINHHEHSNFEFALWLQRVKVHEGRAKGQQKVHILIHNYKTENEHWELY